LKRTFAIVMKARTKHDDRSADNSARQRQTKTQNFT